MESLLNVGSEDTNTVKFLKIRKKRYGFTPERQSGSREYRRNCEKGKLDGIFLLRVVGLNKANTVEIAKS